LVFADASYQTEAICGVPLPCAVFPPSSEGAGGHRFRSGRAGFGDKILKSAPEMPRVGRIIGEPQRNATAIAKPDVDVFRFDALHLAQQVGIEAMVICM